MLLLSSLQIMSFPANPFTQGIWSPATDAGFAASLQAANNAALQNGGQGNVAGVVALSANTPDGSTYMSKPVDFNTPLSPSLCSGIGCGSHAVVVATPLPVGVPTGEVQRDNRDIPTTTAGSSNIPTATTSTIPAVATTIASIVDHSPATGASTTPASLVTST